MIEEIKVSLIVGGFTQASDINALLNLQPSVLHERGASRTVGTPPIELDLKYEQNIWTLTIPTQTNRLEDGLNELTCLVKDRREALKEIARKYEAEVSAVVYFKGANPGFSLSSELMAEISSMGVNLDVDLYYLGEEEG